MQHARTARRPLGALAVVLALLGTPLPAAATTAATTAGTAAGDDADPRLHVRLAELPESWPERVQFQVHIGLSEQAVVANPTETPLRALAPDGEPFVEVSNDGVRANISHPFFHQTLVPPGEPADVPRFARLGADPRWQEVSPSPSWGWFDPRLHPDDARDPATVPRRSQETVLARWSIPLRYGDRQLSAEGTLVLEPFQGSWQPGRLRAPDGVEVQLLPGAEPMIALTRTSAERVEVLGLDAQPMLVLTPAGVRVDPDSPAASTSRGESTSTTSPSSTSESLTRVSGGTFHTWVDPRTLPPGQVPTNPEHPTVRRWQIPVVVDGEQSVIQGQVRWRPAPGLGEAEADQGSSWTFIALGVGGGFLVAVLAAVVARRLSTRDEVTADEPTTG